MLDSWKTGERYGMNIIADLNSGCEGWIDWNLCLDELGGRLVCSGRAFRLSRSRPLLGVLGCHGLVRF